MFEPHILGAHFLTQYKFQLSYFIKSIISGYAINNINILLVLTLIAIWLSEKKCVKCKNT